MDVQDGVTMSSEFISAGAGVALSLALTYVPGLKERWNALAGDKKRAVLAGLLMLIALMSLALGCAGLFSDYSAECSRSGLETVLGSLFAALSTSQAAYILTGKEDAT